MTCFVVSLLSFGMGAIVAGAYASREVRKVKADALRLLLAQQVDLSAEDAIRRAGC